MDLQFVPVFVPSAKGNPGAAARKTAKASEILMETVVVLFFSLGPVVGAVLFLMWFGGLTWGVLSSLFR